MNSLGMMRFFPVFVSVGLLVLAISLWPVSTHHDVAGNVAWLNIILLLVFSGLTLRYGIRLLREREERRAGSRLRAKLVMALVGMLLIPAMILQMTASQMVERGLDVWFDVRVDTLLDRTLGLARDFYARVETDLKQGLLPYEHDDILLEAMQEPLNYSVLNARLGDIQSAEGWQRLQLFDVNERLLAGVKENGLATLKIGALEESAKLAVTLGRVVTILRAAPDREVAVGYAPLQTPQGVKGLLRAEITLPAGVVKNARAVELDYKKYRGLERNRQSIRSLFTQTMLTVTLLVLLIAGIVALIFARKLTAPITGLAQALRQVTEGDLDVTIKEAPRDELGSLVRSFNRMAFKLKENVEALQHTQAELTESLETNRQRRHILESLLGNLQTGVLLLDSDAHIRLLNESMKSMLALPPAWIPGRGLEDLCDGRLHGVGQFFSQLQHQSQQQLQQELDIIVGSHNLHILVRGVRLSEHDVSGIVGYLVIFDDVSSLAEAQQHRAWAEVARRLAHEIKNPLTPIKLAAERLQRRFSKTVEHRDVFDACTGTIITQVERLQRLTSDFSTLARLPKPRMGIMHVEQLLHEMGDLYASYARAHVDMAGDPVTPCVCDADQVRQVLINLMDNALAATLAEDGRVFLYVDISDDMIEFHVKDEGHGIPEPDRAHLFDAYFSTKPEGSGLGLAIAKRIAEEHEGMLSIRSFAHPTHFCLCIPREVSKKT